MLKIDMSKAHDRISWRFILKVFTALGFSNQWMDLIYRNISNCWYSIIWKGSTYGYFKSNRGVRQGDPLFPSLFIIAMEYLSKLINAGMERRQLLPYKVEGCKSHVHHLIYADDLLLFSNGHINYVKNLIKALQHFCDLSGQQLNPAKSKIFFSKHIFLSRKQNILKETQFKEDQFPTRYLGAPLFPGRPIIAYFKHLEDNIRNKITGWAKKFLSMAGRATLILSVLNSLSIHTLSVIPTLKTVLHSMERLFANFFWDGKHH
ncbi:unnamed protein product [Rhodiola kirilowii]